MTKLCVTLLIFLCVSKTLQHIPLEFFGNLSNKGTNVGSLSKSEPVKSPALNIKLNVENQLKNVTNNLKQNNFALSSDVQLNKGNTSYMTSIEPGADLRLLSVIISFIALSCLLFVGCRIYRNRKMPKIVKKYGEKRRRTDVEMAPLPLHVDDDDDETVFDVGNLNTRT